MIINRTPHAITIPSSLGAYTLPAPIDPNDIARVDTTTEALPPVDGMPMMRTTWHCIVGLPGYVDGTYHVVSALVAEMAAALGRMVSDLLVPGAQIRDEAGRIIGCAGFTAAESCSPLLRPPSGCAERVAAITTPHTTPAIPSRRNNGPAADHFELETSTRRLSTLAEAREYRGSKMVKIYRVDGITGHRHVVDDPRRPMPESDRGVIPSVGSPAAMPAESAAIVAVIE